MSRAQCFPIPPSGFSLGVKSLLVLDLHKVFKIWVSTQPHRAQQLGILRQPEVFSQQRRGESQHYSPASWPGDHGTQPSWTLSHGLFWTCHQCCHKAHPELTAGHNCCHILSSNVWAMDANTFSEACRLCRVGSEGHFDCFPFSLSQSCHCLYRLQILHYVLPWKSIRERDI